MSTGPVAMAPRLRRGFDLFRGQMARADTGRLLVMDDERLTGLVMRSGIARVVHLQMDLDGA